MKLGDPNDGTMQELSDVLACLSRSAQAGDGAAFRRYFARLTALVSQETLQSTGEDAGVLLDSVLFKDVAGPAARKVGGALGAAGVLAGACFGVVSKANSLGDYLDAGAQGDRLVSAALAHGADEVARAAGLGYGDALEVVSKSMADAAGVDVREIVDANGRASSGTSRAYWQRAWDVAHD